MEKSKTFCAAFWNIASIRNNNTVHACCRFKYPVTNLPKNLDEILIQPEFEQLRNDSLNGKEINGCRKCYLEESLGLKSQRQRYNEEYSCKNISLKFVDIAFDNICNLACDGCWGEFSSTWNEKLEPEKPKKSHIIQIKEIYTVPDSLEKVWFLGGEPLMTNRHKRFLKKINDLSKVEIEYNTNGSFLFDHETLQLLVKTKKVLINVSIDGYGDLNEKVRQGSSWNNILDFLDQIQKNNLPFNIHTTIHKNNWHGIVEIEDFVRKNDYSWTTNVLTYPEHLSVYHISDQDKKIFVEYLKDSTVPNKNYIKEFVYEAGK